MIASNPTRLPMLALLVATGLSGCVTTSPRSGDDGAAVIAPRNETVVQNKKTNPGPAAKTNPTPVRAAAQVMRIWIAPWEDSTGNLYGASEVFTEILPRRWQLASALESPATTVLTPLQLQPRADSTTEPKRKP